MNSTEAETINEFLIANWAAWFLFCEVRGVDPYSDVFEFTGDEVEIPEELT